MYNPNTNNKNINLFFNRNRNYQRYTDFESVNKPLSEPYAGNLFPGSTMNLQTGNELTWRNYRNHMYKENVLFNFVEQGHKFTFDLDSMLTLYLRHIFLKEPLRNPLSRRNLNKVTIKRLHNKTRTLENRKDPKIINLKRKIGIHPSVMLPLNNSELLNLYGL